MFFWKMKSLLLILLILNYNAYLFKKSKYCVLLGCLVIMFFCKNILPVFLYRETPQTQNFRKSKQVLKKIGRLKNTGSVKEKMYLAIQ